jgi:putative Mg2+ transporter-C (MgtC) family protein
MESRDLLLAVLPGFLLRGAFAVLCGGIIGIERERRGKPAGFRTNILICLGSTLYMLVGELLLVSQKPPGLDPTRIAAQVVSGIGFIGAGTILHARGAVTGLTSAATIWVVAGIGLLIGAGFPGLGLVATLLVLVTLEALRQLEPRILGRCQFRALDLLFSDPQGRTRAELALVLAEQDPAVCRYAFTEVLEVPGLVAGGRRLLCTLVTPVGFFLLLVVIPQASLEVPDPFPEPLAKVAESSRTENEEHDHENEQYLRKTQTAKHCLLPLMARIRLPRGERAHSDDGRRASAVATISC